MEGYSWVRDFVLRFLVEDSWMLFFCSTYHHANTYLWFIYFFLPMTLDLMHGYKHFFFLKNLTWMPNQTPPTTFLGLEVRSGLDPLRSNYDWFRNRQANQIARVDFIWLWTDDLQLINHHTIKLTWVELVFLKVDCSWKIVMYRFRYHVCCKRNQQCINLKRWTENCNQGICWLERYFWRPSYMIREKFNLSAGSDGR